MAEPVLSFGIFEVDLEAGELRKRGRLVHLQQQPFAVLRHLLEHPHHVVTREALREALWPNGVTVDFDQSLNKSMTRLRAALGDSAENPRFIETLPKRGYRFIAPIMPAAVRSEAPSEPRRDDAAAVVPIGSPPQDQYDQPPRSWTVSMILPVTVLALLTGALLSTTRPSAAPPNLAAIAANAGPGGALMRAEAAAAHRSYAFALSEEARHTEAVAQARRAVAVEPLSPVTNAALGYVLYAARRYDEAAAQLLHTLEIDRDLEQARRTLIARRGVTRD